MILRERSHKLRARLLHTLLGRGQLCLKQSVLLGQHLIGRVELHLSGPLQLLANDLCALRCLLSRHLGAPLQRLNHAVNQPHHRGVRSLLRLRRALRHLKIADNTIVWFCSDNGPAAEHSRGSAGPLRGRKGTLWEGGIRVPALLEWPGRFPKPRVVKAPVCTSDFYPTLTALAGARPTDRPPGNRSSKTSDLAERS